jgi:hypothetical protein
VIHVTTQLTTSPTRNIETTPLPEIKVTDKGASIEMRLYVYPGPNEQSFLHFSDGTTWPLKGRLKTAMALIGLLDTVTSVADEHRRA